MSGEALWIVLRVVGVLLVLVGSVGFLQGINVLPGSFMLGKVRWIVVGRTGILVQVVYGSVVAGCGIILLLAAAKGSTGRPSLESVRG